MDPSVFLTIIVLVVELFISHVPNPALAATDLAPGSVGRDTGPDLYAGSVRGIRHGDVVDVNVLDNVNLPLVLAKRADGDSVGAIADEVLDEYVSGVGLE